MVRRGGFVPGMVGRSDDRNDGQFGANCFGQNWRPSVWPNSDFDGGVPRGSHAGNPFVSHRPRQYDNVGPNSFGNGREFDSGQYAMGFQFNNEALGRLCGNMDSRPRGPSRSVRSRPTDGQFVPEPSTNCIDIDRSWQTIREALWRTKSRARVFSVASSPYDSSQFVRLPPRLLGCTLLIILVLLRMTLILILLILMFR